jgi:hypothetical protein
VSSSAGGHRLHDAGHAQGAAPWKAQPGGGLHGMAAGQHPQRLLGGGATGGRREVLEQDGAVAHVGGDGHEARGARDGRLQLARDGDAPAGGEAEKVGHQARERLGIGGAATRLPDGLVGVDVLAADERGQAGDRPLQRGEEAALLTGLERGIDGQGVDAAAGDEPHGEPPRADQLRLVAGHPQLLHEPPGRLLLRSDHQQFSHRVSLGARARCAHASSGAAAARSIGVRPRRL